MQAKFGIERELSDEIFYKECENDNGDFHFHSQIEICIVDEGEMNVLINGNMKNLKKGDMSFALSYDSHFYQPVNYSKSSILIIPLHMCSEIISIMENKKVVNPFICNSAITAEIKKYFNKIKKETDNEITVRGYIYVILGLIMDNVSMEVIDGSLPQELLSKILFYIHENYKNDVTLASISLEFGYNQSYISRHFKSHFNIGIKEYLTMVRLKNAITLMHQKKHSITYCALESGFNSLRTFFRAFNKEFHCTPNEYIKQTQKKNPTLSE